MSVRKKKPTTKNPGGMHWAKLQSHSFPAASCDCTFLSYGTPVLRSPRCHQHGLAFPCLLGWKGNLKGAQGTGGGGDPAWPWHCDTSSWPRPGSVLSLAQTPAALPHPPAADGTHRGAGGHREASAGSQWAPSPATEVLELSRCSEADQRISDKLERRFRKRAAVGNQPLCWFLWL